MRNVRSWRPRVSYLHMFELARKNFSGFAAIVFDQEVEETLVIDREILRLSYFAELLIGLSQAECEDVIRVGNRRPIVRPDS